MLAAVGSFLDARHHGGRWLLRIEDLDTPRVVPGSDTDILRTLERLNLHWDGEVTYQSRRLPHYGAALRQLQAAGHTFECSCTRRMLATQEETGYPGTCRHGPQAPGPTATRLRVPDDGQVEFLDRVQGLCRQALGPLGDVVIRRRDGVFAYQLAVVVDDADQNITDVVRGADLLESTAWQLQLQRALGLPAPRYAHLPVVTAPDGGKLAKARASLAVDLADPTRVLLQVLVLLRQQPPPQLTGAEPREVLKWAISNWNPAPLHQIATLPAP